MKRLILTLLTGGAFAASSPAYAAVKTIVLVHGAFADGSGWKPVADILQSHGYSVLVVQEPETSLAADVAATRRVLDKAGPCVLVGHSYGGMIITEAGVHPDTKALVYVAAVQPDVARVCLIWRTKRHRPPRASDRSVTAFWRSTPMRFRMISLQTPPRRSRVSWRYPKYRLQVKHFARRLQLPLGNKSRATQKIPTFDDEQFAVSHSGSVGGAGMAVQERDLAEDVALAEHIEHGVLTVRRGNADPHRSGSDGAKAGPGIALGEYVRAALHRPGDDEGAEAIDVLRRELPE
jgi:pimeloyl-ACP methyl ester carboxylesterase